MKAVPKFSMDGLVVGGVACSVRRCTGGSAIDVDTVVPVVGDACSSACSD